MAEQRFCKPQVGGSIPLASSNLSNTYIISNLARILWCYYKVNAAAGISWSTEPPTQPRAYWFKSETTSREMLLEFRMMDGPLAV